MAYPVPATSRTCPCFFVAAVSFRSAALSADAEMAARRPSGESGNLTAARPKAATARAGFSPGRPDGPPSWRNKQVRLPRSCATLQPFWGAARPARGCSVAVKATVDAGPEHREEHLITYDETTLPFDPITSEQLAGPSQVTQRAAWRADRRLGGPGRDRCDAGS